MPKLQSLTFLNKLTFELLEGFGNVCFSVCAEGPHLIGHVAVTRSNR